MQLDMFAVVVIRGLGLAAAVLAIMTARTAQGATAWAIALVAYPYVALPLYAIFGFDSFSGYTRARRFDDAKLRQQLEAAHRRLRESPPLEDAKRYGLDVFEGLAGMPFTRGNTPVLLVNGAATFDAILHDIGEAREYVLVQFYIVRDDGLGRRLLNALAAARTRGVNACLLYDAIGSHTLTQDYKQALDNAGIRHGAFRSIRGPRSRIQANFRNHRKIVVVDGQVAFVGGHNVGDDYLGLYPKIGAWRDTHVRLAGPVALQAQLAFLEDWHWTMHELPAFLRWEAPQTSSGTAAALMLPTGPANDDVMTGAAMFVEAIGAARERIWLATPYFVPEPAMMTSFRLARLRGVDVRLIMTGKSDNALSALASSTYVPEALKAGARVFSYLDGFMHQKVFLLDDALASVMSANFDVRSFKLNFEIAALVKDQAFARQVAAMLERDMARSEEVQLDRFENVSIRRRFLARVARLLTPVL
jgi:cardiolipin synthase